MKDMKDKKLPKRGQRTEKAMKHADAKEDKKLVKKMVKTDCMK